MNDQTGGGLPGNRPPITRERALELFTNRRRALRLFCQQLDLPEGERLKVLNFYGIGGIGKTLLLRRFQQTLEEEFPNLSFGVRDFPPGSATASSNHARWRRVTDEYYPAGR